MLGMSAFDPMFLRWKNGRLHKVRDVRFSNRALMSSSLVLWHSLGRVLAWVTLLFAVGTGGIQPLQA
jgi:hypothetical protein